MAQPAHPIVLPPPPPPYGDAGVVGAIGWLRLLYPGFFDPSSPNYIDPQSTIIVMLAIAEEFRPPCLSEKMQNIAQAYYAAYLLQDWLNNSAPGGGNTVTNSGIVLSEKEGDISVTYADPNASSNGGSTMPPKGPYEKWSKLNDMCKRGAITTKYGDPVR